MEPFCREKGRMFLTECDLTGILEKAITFLNGAVWRNPKRNSIRAFWNISRKR
ncbi:uncharacterized protein AAEQ78_000538 [Lycaon pictus]|uniref:(raccoon dog) hypothetical protein n=1 Tax=Nyctereutes procyonoides TaxID=34880 RepID=A0A811Y5Q3_NYCPR|nr:unnamed protein product [Nyctereutes procyonoides]